MYNLTEYRQKPDRLTDLLPWGALIAPGVILNKDGSFMKCFAFRGPDLDSATRGELISTVARINNALKRLGEGWALYSEAQRVDCEKYPESSFPSEILLMIDEERKSFFGAGNHYQSFYYFTLVYLPPSEGSARLEKALIERNEDRETEAYGPHHLKTFQVECDRVYNLFSTVMPHFAPLSDDETLTYLHSCVSPKHHIVRTPEIPMYLDAILADTPLITGLEPQLGDHYLKVFTILSFPGSSTPGILDDLNRLNFPYRWVTRFIFMDKQEALKETDKYVKRWFSKRKGIFRMILDTVTQSESQLFNQDALNKASDAEMAKQEIADDQVSQGFFTATVVIMDTDAASAEKKARTVEKAINGRGFTVISETVNAVEAWLGSLPGLCRANIRRPMLNSLNLSHTMPVSAVWAGDEVNKHLKGPALMHVQTSGNTPYRLNLHVGDVGHTVIVGPTGAGKSVLLTHLAAQFMRYPDAQCYYFDKDASARALCMGIGGDFYDLAQEDADSLSFQPLAHVDEDSERAWASEWLYDILRAENVLIDPSVKKLVWEALKSLAAAAPEERSITGFTYLVQDDKIRQALQPITLKGPFGRLFDAHEDNLSYGRFQIFEMAQLMNTPSAVAPTLQYLFHKIEKRLTGVPTLLPLDEAWLFLDNPMFADKIREWLKVLRKANASVVFATQSIPDFLNSPIAPTIMDACYTRIFLPNPNARDEEQAVVYKKFGLNEREIQIIASATPKRQYYYKSIRGSRLFELAAGPIALAYTGASSKNDQKAILDIVAKNGKGGFNTEWLKHKNLPQAAELYSELKNLKQEVHA